MKLLTLRYRRRNMDPTFDVVAHGPEDTVPAYVLPKLALGSASSPDLHSAAPDALTTTTGLVDPEDFEKVGFGKIGNFSKAVGKEKTLYTHEGTGFRRPASLRRLDISQKEDTKKASWPPVPTTPSAHAHKRKRAVPTFNICVAGGPSSGKTGFLRTLVRTMTVEQNRSSTASLDILNTDWDTSSSIASATFITTSMHGQRLRLSLTEHPSIAFHEDGAGSNLHAEMRILELERFIEGKFAESVVQEAEVVRHTANAADGHVHVCLYFLTPSMFAAQDKQPGEKNKPGYTLDSLHRAVIERLAKRVTVIPVIGRADELTIKQLELTRAAMRELPSFDPHMFARTASRSSTPALIADTEASGSASDETLPSPETDTEVSRARSLRRSRSVSSCHRKKRLQEDASPERPSVKDMDDLFPISLIAPEETTDESEEIAGEKQESKEETGLPRFARRYRFGTVDVEGPQHCDFTRLRELLFSTGWKRLKEATADKYETYRTEQLLRHRASSTGRLPARKASA